MKRFTLIELIVVIAILGVLAAIIIPNISSWQQKAEEVQLQADIRNTQTGVDNYLYKIGNYPTTYQPYFSNEVIDWSLMHPNYVRSVPKLKNADKSFYVTHNGEVVVNYNTNAEFLKWLKESKFIVENPSDPIYEGTNPELGSVFLNYNTSTDRFRDYLNEQKTLILSTAVTGDALLEAHAVTSDEVFLNRAKLIGNHLKTKIYQETLYGNTNFHKITAMTKYNGSTWVDLNGEGYSKDMLISAKFLIRLSILTGDGSYAQEGEKLLDSLYFVQKTIDESPTHNGISGALAESYPTGGMGWVKFPLDIAYMMYDATYYADIYFEDPKYLSMKDKYFGFMERSFTTYNGISATGYPYEYIVNIGGSSFEGQNHDQIKQNEGNPNHTGPNEAFTTDQFFYTLLGLSKNGSPRANAFYDKAKELHGGNYMFWGQYNLDGNSYLDSSGDQFVETVNTALYLELAKRYNPENEREIAEKLFFTMIDDSSDINSHRSMAWSPGEIYIESLASAFSAHKILEQIR